MKPCFFFLESIAKCERTALFISIQRRWTESVENDLSPTVFFQGGHFCDWENRFCMGVCDGDSVRGPVELRARVGLS